MHKPRLTSWLGLVLMTPAAMLQAQLYPGQLAPLPSSSDPADRLAANLLLLSQNPNDVRALTEAGLSAVAVGDGNAALSFLARAEALAPRNGRVKAGLGSALLLIEKPTEALKLFGEASALGVPDSEIARDRGLAYDLRGDPRRAQRDYAIALRGGADDEVTRRYALSLGISGDRDKALDMLDPLLRKQDRAAWRARAFVLAMTGGLSAAESLAMQIMPAGSGASMSPFLRRLSTLNAAERALAVNLGIMPSDGAQYAMVQTGDPHRPSGVAGDGLIPAGDPLGIPKEDMVPRRLEPDSRDPRRRPGTGVASAAPPPTVSPISEPRPGFAENFSLPPRVTTVLQPSSSVAAIARPSAPAAPVARTPDPAPVFEVPLPVPQPKLPPAPISNPSPRLATVVEAPSPEPATRIGASTATPEVSNSAPTRSAPVNSSQPFSLSAIIATIETEEESAAGPLPDEAALRATRAALQKKAAVAAKAGAEAKAVKDRKDAEQLAAKKNPARLWVQVATGANNAGLPLTWKRLREKAPDALKGLSASSAQYKSTNRLLVGPFKSSGEAKKVVNALSKAGVSTFTFNSDAGQEIVKVASK